MKKQGVSSFIWLIIMLVAVAILSFWFLFIDFRGLTHPRGMEQATIAREIARGNGFQSKSIRCFALHATEQQAQKTGKEISIQAFPNTVHSPLYPLVQSFALKASQAWWEFDEDSPNTEKDKSQKHTGIYQPDRILTALSIFFFILAVGVNFLLLWRMFDETIASFTALTLITCEMLWKLTQTGMPHMLMLLLFSLALLFLHRAIESNQQNKPAFGAIITTAICFALLALSHWLCLWIIAGAIAFICIFFQSKKALYLLIFIAIQIPGIAWWLIDQSQVLGSNRASGIGFLTPLSQVQMGELANDDIIMRGYTEESTKVNPKDLPARLALSTTDQIRNLFAFLGNIVAAPIFFIALLQPFRRASSASLRWGIVLMWIPAAIGMSFYGLHEDAKVANQLHYLFIPIMSGYGLAFISLLWSRLDIPSELPLRRIMPLILISLISVLPLLLSIVRQVRLIPYFRDVNDGGTYPISVNAMREARNTIPEDEYVFSDIPWAVAWYADKNAVWLPLDLPSTYQLLESRTEKGEKCAGIVLSLATFNQPLYTSIAAHGSNNDAYAHLSLELIHGSMLEQRRAYEENKIPFSRIRRLSIPSAGTPPIYYYTPSLENNGQ